jgi:hypothetical protein
MRCEAVSEKLEQEGTKVAEIEEVWLLEAVVLCSVFLWLASIKFSASSVCFCSSFPCVEIMRCETASEKLEQEGTEVTKIQEV